MHEKLTKPIIYAIYEVEPLSVSFSKYPEYRMDLYQCLIYNIGLKLLTISLYGISLFMTYIHYQPSQEERLSTNIDSIPDLSGKALSIRGPIDPDELGMTLMHEHLFIENITTKTRAPTIDTPMMQAAFWDHPLTIENLQLVRTRRAFNRDNSILADMADAIEEANEFRNSGGSTLVDVTSIGIRRDPVSLMKVAMSTGLNIIAGSSWYVKDSYPDNMDDLTIESLTEVIVRDITKGIGETGIRSGIIGEVGVQGEPLTNNELKVIRASARASRLTGAPISFHWGGTGSEKLDVASAVAEEGGEMSRTIFGHSDMMAGDIDLMLELLERGVYIQFDLLGRVGVPLTWDTLNPDSPWPESQSISGTALVADAITKLIEAGFEEKLLISQDVCMKFQLKRYGGTGYSFIPEVFLPYLRRIGVTEKQIRLLVVDNPKNILTFVKPG